MALKRVCKPNFKRSLAVKEDLVIMQIIISNLKRCKPVYMGFSALDLSKLLMYQFHYEHMLKSYKKINMCSTDMDTDTEYI